MKAWKLAGLVTVCFTCGAFPAWATPYNLKPAYEHPRLYFFEEEIGNTTTGANTLNQKNSLPANPVGRNFSQNLKYWVDGRFSQAKPVDGAFDRWNIPWFMSGCAMLYLIQKDYAAPNAANAYADKAADWFKYFLGLVDPNNNGSLVDETPAVQTNWDTTFNAPTGLQETLAALVKVYDWIYTYQPGSGNYLTAWDKQRFRQLLAEQMVRLNSAPFNANWTRRLYADALAAVALDGENAGPEGGTANLLPTASWAAAAQSHVDALLPPDAQFKEYFYPYGPDYGDLDTNWLFEMIYLFKKHGVSDASGRRSVKSVKEYYQSILLNTGGDECYCFPIFDAGLLGSYLENMTNPGVYSRPAGVYAGALLKMAYVLQDGQIQALFNDAVWETHHDLNWGITFSETLWMNQPLVPVAPSAEQLWHFYPEHDVLAVKSGWTVNDTALMFRCGPPKNIHHDMDANGFMLYAGGDWFAVEETGYNGMPDAQGHPLYKSTRPHCTLLIDDAGQANSDLFDYYQTSDINRYPSLQTLNVSHVLHSEAASYAVGHAAGAYVFNVSGADHVLQRFDRHLLFLPPDLVIVCDDLRDTLPHTYTWMFNVTPRERIDIANPEITRIVKNTVRVADYTRTSEMEIYHAFPPAAETTSAISDLTLSPYNINRLTDHLDRKTVTPAASQVLLNVLRTRPTAAAAWPAEYFNTADYAGCRFPAQNQVVLAARQDAGFQYQSVQTDAKLAWIQYDGALVRRCFSGGASRFASPEASWLATHTAACYLSLDNSSGQVSVAETTTLSLTVPRLAALTIDNRRIPAAADQASVTLAPGSYSFTYEIALHPPRNLHRSE